MKSVVKVSLTFTAITLGTLCAAPGITPVAHAAPEDTIQSGAMCQQNAGSVTALSMQLAGAYNSGSQGGIIVTCPLVRLNRNSNGTSVVWVEVYRDAQSPGDISCNLASVEWTGQHLALSPQGTFSGTGAGGIPLNVSTSSIWSHYTVQCWLPARSRIVNIFLGEKG